MKVGFVVVIIAALAGIAAAVAFGRGSSASTQAGTPASQSGAVSTAAPVAKPLLLRGTDPMTGKPVSLASFRGKPIVLNFWSSSCAACAAEARALAKFERAHREAQVIGIDVQDSRSSARAWTRRFGWRHPNIFDPTGAISVRVGVQSLPTTYFLDRQHRVVVRVLGQTDLAGFTNGLRRALA